MYFEEPEEILYNFLRARVAELPRVNYDNRMDSASQTFAGDGTTVEFFITDAKTEAIVSVTVGGVEQIPYSAYNIDLDNSKIKFRVAPANEAVIIVNYLTGVNWIFPDSPRVDLKEKSFPRIGSWQITETTSPEELGTQTNSYDSVVFQIDVVTYKDQLCIINNEQKSDVNVAKHLARLVKNAFKDYVKTDLIYVVLDFQIIENNPIPFQDDLNIFRRLIQVRFIFRNLRRMIT